MCIRDSLYVLDEPSIGLHPSNIVGLTGVMHDLVADGNSVILVDHDTQILKEADWIIEMGPEAGANGGHVIAEGTIPAIEANSASQIGPFLSSKAETIMRQRIGHDKIFENDTIHLSTSQIHKMCIRDRSYRGSGTYRINRRCVYAEASHPQRAGRLL